MKKLVLIAQDLSTLVRREKVGLIIILLSLSLSVCASLTMVSFYSSYREVFQRMRIDKASYKVLFNVYAERDGQLTPMEVFDDFLLSDSSPSVIDGYAMSFLTYPSEDFTITFGSVSHNENGPEAPPGPPIRWRAYFPGERLSALSEREEEKHLLEGRLFTDEELQEGAAVAVVGRNSFPGAHPGDRIEVLGREIEIIGVRRMNNALPYRLMQVLSDKEQGFAPDSFMCIFEEPLTEELLEQLNHKGVSLTSYFDIRKSGYYTEIAISLSIISGILLLTVLNTLNMFRYLVLKARYRLMVMKVCGAGKKTVFEALYLIPLLASMVSSATGILLYRLLLEPIIVREFSFSLLTSVELLIVFSVVLLLCFLTLIPTVWRIVKARPVDMVLWR